MPIYKTGKSKDGKQQYRVIVCFTDSFGKYKQISKCVYGSAEAKLTEMELQHKVAERETPLSITVQQLSERYLTAMKPELRESTYIKKCSVQDNHILPSLGPLKLSKLTAPVLQNWKNEIAQKDLSIRMKQNIYRELRAMLNFAEKMDFIKQNNLTKLGNFKDAYSLADPEDKIRYYTAEQFKLFIAAAGNHLKSLNDHGYYTFFMIAFYTGMRKGEINALRWCDIKDNVIHITRSVNQKIKGRDYEFTPPKNASSVRKLQIPSNLATVLEEQKKVQQKNCDRWTEQFLVCGGINCLSDTAISNKNIQYAKEAGIEPIRIHDFRHTHATLLVNSGISIQEIARRLGHADVTVTWNVYSHLYPREEERAIKVLESI